MFAGLLFACVPHPPAADTVVPPAGVDPTRPPGWLALAPGLAPYDVAGAACATEEGLQRQEGGGIAGWYRVWSRDDHAAQVARLDAAAAALGRVVTPDRDRLRVDPGDGLVLLDPDAERLLFDLGEEGFAAEAARLLADTPLLPLVAALGGWGRVRRVERDWAGGGASFSLYLDRDPARSPWDDEERVRSWAGAAGFRDAGFGTWTGDSALGPVVVQFSSERLTADGGSTPPHPCAP